MRCVISGAAGFIGSELTRRILAATDWDVIAVDGFRHRGVTDRLTATVDGVRAADYLGNRLTVVTHDLAVPISAQLADHIGDVDCVLALASGSHVGASLADPRSFAENNVAVMLTTLEYARQARPGHVIVVSTDEVYGPSDPGATSGEWDAIVPSTPYSASKAAQESLAVAWWRSFGVPVTIVNMHNVYGPLQGAEKLIPLVISAVADGRMVGIHGTEADGGGSRCWLNVADVAAALIHVASELPPERFGDGAARPARWHIASQERMSNVDVSRRIAALMGKELRWEWSDARPGHDGHYGLDGSRLAAAGWKPEIPFAEGLDQTVRWYLENPGWLLP